MHRDTGYTGTDEDAMYLSTSIVRGGSDNPKRAMNGFVMAAICHPDKFLQARKEIDTVCDDQAERLPCIADMTNIPYVCAIIKELLSWRPPVLMTPTHELTEDLQFKGHHFPKGTNFLINSVATCSEYENLEEFKPERWLDENVFNITHRLWQFGGGRRVCPWYRVAQQGLFVTLTRLIYHFDYAAVLPFSLRASILMIIGDITGWLKR